MDPVEAVNPVDAVVAAHEESLTAQQRVRDRDGEGIALGNVGEAYLGPVQLAAGEQVSTELIGPPTTTFVDSTNCRVMNP